MIERRHAQRGQAVVETVIFLPMFLLTLFGILWAVQVAVQFERSESAIRYAGLISSRANPYVTYSLYSMYTQLGSATIPTPPCTTPLADPLSDAAPTYTSTHTVTASQPFWAPTGGTVPSCSGNTIVGFPSGSTFSQDLLLSEQRPTIRALINVTGPLTSALGPATAAEADQLFVGQIGEPTIVACYPTLNLQVTSSLKFATDASAATTPVALSNTVPAQSIPANTTCTTL